MEVIYKYSILETNFSSNSFPLFDYFMILVFVGVIISAGFRRDMKEFISSLFVFVFYLSWSYFDLTDNSDRFLDNRERLSSFTDVDFFCGTAQVINHGFLGGVKDNYQEFIVDGKSFVFNRHSENYAYNVSFSKNKSFVDGAFVAGFFYKSDVIYINIFRDFQSDCGEVFNYMKGEIIKGGGAIS